MAFTPKNFFKGKVPSAVEEIATIDGGIAEIKNIVIANITAGAITIDLYFLDIGSVARTDNDLIFKGFSIAANTTVFFSTWNILPTGGSIHAVASAVDSLTLNIDGALFT